MPDDTKTTRLPGGWTLAQFQSASTKERAYFVVGRLGKSRNTVDHMSEAEVASVAALAKDDGSLVENPRDKLRDILIDYYERRKASSDEADDEPETEDE